MSREHLYKAKRVNWSGLPKDEWWVEGYLTQRKGGDGKVFESWIILDAYEQFGVLNMKSALVSETDFNCYKVDSETVCEYTGLTDKSRKKIFENDILSFSQKGQIASGVVKMVDGCFFAIIEGQKCWLSEGVKRYKREIIGNIFDNPELLEGGEAE